MSVSQFPNLNSSQPGGPSDLPSIEQRLWIEHLVNPGLPSAQQEDTGEDVIQGLTATPKTLPPRYFYDDRGSQLFEQICDLPEYYLTRTETAILQQMTPELAGLTGPCELVELGSGASVKTRLLLDAYQERDLPLYYCPIDVSAGILESSARSLLLNYPRLKVHGLVGTYELALQRLRPPLAPRRMIAFIGSTLGNLTVQECDRFLQQIAQSLRPGDYFLLGIDLHKDCGRLEAAYNDRQGVTAEFNLNMLSHLNWRFEGNFDRSQFQHRAFYNQELHQIEMHLCSLITQTVELRRLNLSLTLAAGETILTEISRKFDLAQIQAELEVKQLHCLKVWTDLDQAFGVLLCQFQA